MNKNKTIFILLLISIAFNLAFIGNYFYHRYLHTPFYLHNCNLPQNKLEHFRRLRYSMIKQRRNYLKKRREFMRMLQTPEFNEKELKNKLDETINEEIEMERKIGENFIKLRSQMNDKEAHLFFRRFLKPKNIKRRIRP